VKPIELGPAARTELDAAVEHYELERSGRGVRFYAAVERATRLISRFPEAGPAYPRVAPSLGVRRWKVRGFPFVIAYRMLDDVIRIDAVAHTRRRPRYWASRMRRR
jgi:toxin ParE1/3/4